MERTAGIVLAGGAGERLGAVFKPALRIGGHRILDTVLAALEPDLSPVLISTGNVAAHRFSPWHRYRQIPDDPRLSCRGPAAGLLSTVASLDLPGDALILTVPGDCPLIPGDLRERLRANLTDATDVCMARAGEQLYPTHALWRVSALRECLRAERGAHKKSRGLRHLLPANRTAFADWDEAGSAEAFASLNTLADLVRMARKPGASGLAN